MKDCNQCGKCCIKYGGADLAATKDEIDLWEIFNPDIFKYVKSNQIWFDPQSGARLERCPFLELAPKQAPASPDKYTCSIYLNRPEDCRQYPSLISEMIRDECEMIELVDLDDQMKAQARLNVLMRDSRAS
ncbi:YkgJ family cysteine cluster protein [Simiduia curdlanivorans]|uniref:YkgJ family cysteine cluster protein n=1 Tax=Simiduia curdlanivorans TaxID=1492769 RepID=A0ABV8V2L3_9GAMM|nr:YkgJ family cysteine cluster protein [Simiduia curdlanivorans]MDN3641041.1 YkgJ family cysteine cluster protein [Simiduia curdlanivorans]